MRYYVSIGEHAVEVDLSGPIPLVDGEPFAAELSTIPGTKLRQLRIGAESHELFIESGGRRGLWTVFSGGRSLQAEVVDERTRAIRSLSRSADAEAAKVVVAPMPGLVVRLNVEVGQTVTAGQGVIVVEAMKMENEIKAPADGVVASIEVAMGDTVEKGRILLVIE